MLYLHQLASAARKNGILKKEVVSIKETPPKRFLKTWRCPPPVSTDTGNPLEKGANTTDSGGPPKPGGPFIFPLCTPSAACTPPVRLPRTTQPGVNGQLNDQRRRSRTRNPRSQERRGTTWAAAPLKAPWPRLTLGRCRELPRPPHRQKWRSGGHPW